MTTPRPRIAVLADWWWPQTVGGAERSARAVAHHLSRFAEVTVFVPATRDEVYRDEALTVCPTRRPFARRRHADTRLRRGLEFLSAWLLPPVATPLIRRLTAYQPDLVIAHNISRTGPWLVRWVRARRLPFIRVCHDLSDTCWRRARFRGGRVCTDLCGSCRVKAAAMRRALPEGRITVCVSGFVRDQMVQAGLTTPTSSAVGYPLADATPRLIPRQRPASPDEETRDGELVLGYIGRLDPTKGIEDAIRVAAAFRQATGRQVSVLVAGEGRPEYATRLAELAERAAVPARFPGHLDIDAFCGQVDAVMIPSAWPEPFGRVAVEVGVRGRPMLVSPVGGLPEAARLSGGRYAFADFRDPEAAASVLVQLLDGTHHPEEVVEVPAGSPVSLPEAVAAAARRLLGDVLPTPTAQS